MTAPAALHRPTEVQDPLYRGSRGLLYLGLFFSSLLVVRAGGLTIGDYLIGASLISAMVVRSLNPRTRWPSAHQPIGTTVVLLITFLVGALVSVGNAFDQTDSLLIVARLIVVIFALPWLARTLLPTRRHVAAATAWTFAGTAVSMSGTLIQFAFGPDAIPGGTVTNVGRFTGFTGHVSDAGGIACIGLAIGVGFVLQRRRWIWAAAASGVVAVGLVLSGSVSGMLAAVVGVLVYVIRGQLKFRYLFLLVALGVGVLWATASIQSSANARGPIERVLQTLGLSDKGMYSTSDIRIETYEVAISRFLASPVAGHGFDPTSAIADGMLPPHNVIIGALFQGGVLVGIVILAMLIRPFRGGWLRIDRSMVGTQVIAAACAAITFAMTAPSLYNRYLWIPVALVLVTRSIALSQRLSPDVMSGRASSDLVRSAELPAPTR